MAPKRVEFHEEAALEMLSAIHWYFLRNKEVASRFAKEITRAVELIVEAPKRWPSYSRETRKFVLRQFPFLLIYRELTDVIQILAVAHSHRRPGYWKHLR